MKPKNPARLIRSKKGQMLGSGIGMSKGKRDLKRNRDSGNPRISWGKIKVGEEHGQQDEDWKTCWGREKHEGKNTGYRQEENDGGLEKSGH